jgi:hypothetical protein
MNFYQCQFVEKTCQILHELLWLHFAGNTWFVTAFMSSITGPMIEKYNFLLHAVVTSEGDDRGESMQSDFARTRREGCIYQEIYTLFSLYLLLSYIGGSILAARYFFR